MAVGALLEGLQGLTPDRHPNLLAALCGAVGTLAAALLAELFIRARMRRAVARSSVGPPANQCSGMSLEPMGGTNGCGIGAT